jgi:hypothetical protein
MALLFYLVLIPDRIDVGLTLGGWQCGISLSRLVVCQREWCCKIFCSLAGIILIAAGDNLLHFFLSKQISMMTDINSQSLVVEKKENGSSSHQRPENVKVRLLCHTLQHFCLHFVTRV